jgi:type IV secretion system protein VirB9
MKKLTKIVTIIMIIAFQGIYIAFADNVVADSTQDAIEAATREADIVFAYTPGSIYRIYAREGYLTDIKLQSGEEIGFIGGGDTVRWMVDKAASGSGNERQWHIYLKPLRRNIETNIIINTNKRTYQIEAKANGNYNPIVSWAYPGDEKAAILRQSEIIKGKQEDDLLTVVPQSLNFGYKIFGKAYPWKPATVFDDGRRTFIKMPEKNGCNRSAGILHKGQKG